VHDPEAEWYTCVLEEDEDDDANEHICCIRVHHLGDHECSCGYFWARSADDDW
jgi:hypothetical protein